VSRLLAVLAVCEHRVRPHTHLCTLPSKFSRFETSCRGWRSQNSASSYTLPFVFSDGRWHSAVFTALRSWPWTITTRAHLCRGLPHLYSWPPQWLLCKHNGQDGCVCTLSLNWLVCQGKFFLPLLPPTFVPFCPSPCFPPPSPHLFPLLPLLSPLPDDLLPHWRWQVTPFSSLPSCRV